jgi:hypothetical protein
MPTVRSRASSAASRSRTGWVPALGETPSATPARPTVQSQELSSAASGMLVNAGARECWCARDAARAAIPTPRSSNGEGSPTAPGGAAPISESRLSPLMANAVGGNSPGVKSPSIPWMRLCAWPGAARRYPRSAEPRGVAAAGPNDPAAMNGPGDLREAATDRHQGRRGAPSVSTGDRGRRLGDPRRAAHLEPATTATVRGRLRTPAPQRLMVGCVVYQCMVPMARTG